MQSAITAIGTATPQFQRTQDDLVDLIAEGFHLHGPQKKILKRIYAASGIDQRHSVLADYCRQPGAFEFFPNEPSAPFPSTEQRMAVYQNNALNLALTAIHDCLNDQDGSQITHVITVSCTGMYAPGLDIEIVQALKLSPSTKRTSINFMGCYGAFNGMKVADSICRADPDSTVLLVCVELCSIHMQNKFTLDSIVSNALFADGAAAVLIQNPSQSSKPCMTFKSFYCDIVPQTHHDMTWHIGNSGFDMVLSAYVPEAIKMGIAAFTNRLLEQNGISFQDIDYFAIHPGGVKILQACEASFGISEKDLYFSYEILRQYGNMSSATILFVLKEMWPILNSIEHKKTLFGCAFGPGLTLESVLLEMN